MNEFEALIQRASQTQHGFTDLKRTYEEIVTSQTPDQALALADQLYASDVRQARMIAVYIYGHFAAEKASYLVKMREVVSADHDWRVQEILAQAFDEFCEQTGYEAALPIIQDWLNDERANVRRAVSEGLRIWTARPYFKQHPEMAIEFLAPLHADSSEYVRKSIGNALRDISRAYPDLIKHVTGSWDVSNKHAAQTYKLATKFLKDES